MNSILKLATAFLFLVTIAACSDSTGPRSKSGIHVVTGGEPYDTMMATRIFMIEVRDKQGNPAANKQVSFTVDSDVLVAPSVSRVYPFYMCGITFSFCAWFAGVGYENHYLESSITDADGLFTARIQFGPMPGTTKLIIRVPELEMEHTVTYIILRPS